MKNFCIGLVGICLGFGFWLCVLQIFLYAPAPPLKIPTTDQVDKVVVTGKNDRDLFIIKDRNKINAILEFVQKHNNNWEFPLGETMPVYPHSAVFSQNKQSKLVIWLGTGGLGARDKNDSSSNRLRSLSSKEEKQLFDLIGIPYEGTESNGWERSPI